MNKPINVTPAPTVILGCGLSGMLTALSFARHGLATTIIESADTQDEKFFSDNRTTAITASSQKFLQALGVWDSLKKFCSPINHIYVVDNKSPEMLHFADESEVNQAMGYIIENTDFKKILLSSLLQTKGITLLDKCNYQQIKSSSEACELHLSNGEFLEADLVIICDGRNSYARSYYFSSKLEKYYGQHALTFNVEHEERHEQTAVEHFMPSGPFAILPLLSPHSSSIVWTVPNIMRERLLALPACEFEYLLQQNFGNFLGKVRLNSKISSFPLKAYITEKYFYQRLVLLADTAHIIHPLAGQGLNQGIKDITELTNQIASLGASERALVNYQALRQDDNMAMYLITDNLNRIFSNHSGTLRQMRNVGFKTIQALPYFKNKLIKYAMGKR